MNKVYVHMHPRSCDVIIAFIHDKHEIEVNCAAIGCEIVVVCSLQLLYYLRHSCTVSTPACPLSSSRV